jgi:DNA-binding MarR family transcriptional regulator
VGAVLFVLRSARVPLLVASVIESRIFTLINERGVRNPGDFDTLAVLRRTGDPYELSPKQLAGQLLVTSAGLRGKLDRLQTAGLIGRRSHPTDRRAVIVTVTRRGRELGSSTSATPEAIESQADPRAFVSLERRLCRPSSRELDPRRVDGSPRSGTQCGRAAT